ncbi:MAG: MEDS domain-containing protein [Nocardioides sp.]
MPRPRTAFLGGPLAEKSALPPHDHAVAFYDGDVEAIAAVAPFVVQGLTQGERVVVVVTGPHRTALDVALRDAGIDPDQVRASGAYVVRDAAETLGSLMVDGAPDRARFLAGVGGLLAAAGDIGCPGRVFGEMVALLWDRGQVTAALELESLWNDLAKVAQFSLLCAYPTTALGQARLGEVGRMCELHSMVIPPAGYDFGGSTQQPERHARPDGVWSETFLPVTAAVSAARQFVTGVLDQWGEIGLVWEASLVTSELATNAVLHGGSPFRASVSRAHGRVRIAIEDVAAGWPERRAATTHGLDGRGVAIVDALATRSGCDALLEGKVAWAELAMTS